MSKKVRSDACHVFYEIRYTSHPKLLDNRGDLVQRLSDSFGFGQWKFDPNRIDVADAAENDRRRMAGFVSVVNCGFVLNDPGTETEFIDKGTNFLRFLIDGSHILPNKVVRIGVKATFLKRVNSSFEKLRTRLSDKYLCSDLDFSRLGAGEVDDVGFLLWFKTPIGKLNTQLGPVRAAEISRFIPFDLESPPEVGVIFVADSFTENPSSPNAESVYRGLREHTSKVYDTFASVAEYLDISNA